jgi:hypothetical protein
MPRARTSVSSLIARELVDYRALSITRSRMMPRVRLEIVPE